MQRSYQGNASSSKPAANNRPAAGARTGAPAKQDNFVPAAKGTQPTYLLKVKGGDGKFITLTGLFANEPKNGGDVYYKGKAKDGEFAGIDFYVMTKLENTQEEQ